MTHPCTKPHFLTCTQPHPLTCTSTHVSLFCVSSRADSTWLRWVGPRRQLSRSIASLDSPNLHLAYPFGSSTPSRARLSYSAHRQTHTQTDSDSCQLHSWPIKALYKQAMTVSEGVRGEGPVTPTCWRAHQGSRWRSRRHPPSCSGPGSRCVE